MKTFLLMLFGFIIVISTSVLVMIEGWGLEPKSWVWIIPLNFFGHLFAQIIFEVGKQKETK